MSSDNLRRVAVCGPKGRFQRYRTLRVLGGRIHLTGETVTLAVDSIPFEGKKYQVIGCEKDGTPRVRLLAKAMTG